MERIIMHIDVNNAFLSWTAIYLLKQGSKYDIRNSYAVIGGDENSRKGVVLAKSTAAKKLGIKTGETLYSARKKCRVLKTYPMNYSFYQEMSKKLFKLIKTYTPDVEIASIDECYLDYSGIKHIYGEEISFASKLQKEINEKLGFTVNIGIANNKLCAKMASDFSKPNKIHTLYKSEIEMKMWPLDIGDLFGIGKKSKEKLLTLNIKTIGDLAHSKREVLYKYFKNQAPLMIDWANGIDDSKVISEEVALKGISNEITLKMDINTKSGLYKYLLELSEKVGRRLRKEHKYANVVAVIIKDKYFKRRTHQKKLDNPIHTSQDIFAKAKEVLNEMWNNEEVRLIGIRLEKLNDKMIVQKSLFEKNEIERDNLLEGAIDNLKEKYGDNVIKRTFNERKD